MIVRPYFRGALCAFAHPAGCRLQVESWCDRVRGSLRLARPLRVLVIGSSSGLGLAARVAATFGAGGPSVGVALERPGATNRLGSAGWYRSVAFEDAAARAGVLTRTVIGDAFDDRVKRVVADLVSGELGTVDLMLYTVATSRRTDPSTGRVRRSVIKTIGAPFHGRDYDLGSRTVRAVTMPAATDDEIDDTIAVMGGEDLRAWVQLLLARGLFAPGARCAALSYVGSPLLAATYRNGTLGAAKDDLERTVVDLDATLTRACAGSARVAVMPALVTQSSVAIPMSALYTMLLMAVLAERDLTEDVVGQGLRLVATLTGHDTVRPLDDLGRIRLDDSEQKEDVQTEVGRRWRVVSTGSLPSLGAVDVFEHELRALYGFDIDGVDYAAPVEPVQTSDRLVLA